MEVVWSDLAFELFSNMIQYIQGFFGKKTADDIAIKIISFIESLGTRLIWVRSCYAYLSMERLGVLFINRTIFIIKCLRIELR